MRSSVAQLNLDSSANFSSRGNRGGNRNNRNGGDNNDGRPSGNNDRGSGYSQSGGNGGNHNYNGGNGGGNCRQNYGSKQGYRSSNGGGQNNYGNGGSGGGQPVWQICDRTGHTALKCYDRFDHLFQAEDPRVANYSAHNQGYHVDNRWYNDTGATDHITNDLDRLSVHERYNGKEKIQTANGTGSCIEDGASSRHM